MGKVKQKWPQNEMKTLITLSSLNSLNYFKSFINALKMTGKRAMLLLKSYTR